MSKNYKLKVSDDGKVRYITRAGKDLYQGKATEEQAGWMMKNKPITRETPTDWPEFCVCADGAYWFEGSWDGEPETVKDKSIFEAEDAQKDIRRSFSPRSRKGRAAGTAGRRIEHV